MELLKSIDIQIFDIIAFRLKNGIFDFLMPILSDFKIWIIPLSISLLLLIIFGKRKGLQTIILCILAVSLSDFICGNILKPFFHRTRPLGGTTLSFPSCHASNVFAASMIISYIWKKYYVIISVIFLACLVGFSRVYTTSHYPSDVIVGAMIGILVSLLIIYLSKLFMKSNIYLKLKLLIQGINKNEFK